MADSVCARRDHPRHADADHQRAAVSATDPRASRTSSSVPVAIVTGDYFLAEPIQHELQSLGASIRFKPLWLEDLIALAQDPHLVRPP